MGIDADVMASEAISLARRRWFLVAVVGLMSLRLLPAMLIFRYPQRALFPDSHGYLALAADLLQRAPYGSSLSSAALDLARPPGYPLFLALVQAAGGGHGWVALLQLLMTDLMALGAYLLARRVLRPAAAFAAMLVYLLLPNPIYWALAVLSDTLFTLILVLALGALVVHGRSSRTRSALVSGLLLGAGVLVRPIGLVLVPLWAGWLGVVGARRKGGRRSGAAGALLFLCGAVVVVLPWMARNWAKYGQFTVSSIAVRNLGHYQAPAALARATGISLEEARQQIPTTRVPRPGEARKALEVILQHPTAYLAVHLEGTGIMLKEAGEPNLTLLTGFTYRGSGAVGLLREGDVLSALRALWDARSSWERLTRLAVLYGRAIQVFLYLTALLGALVLVRSARAETQALAWLLILTAGLLLAVPGPVANARFRVPAEPLLAVLSAAGLGKVWSVGRRALGRFRRGGEVL